MNSGWFQYKINIETTLNQYGFSLKTTLNQYENNMIHVENSMIHVYSNMQKKSQKTI